MAFRGGRFTRSSAGYINQDQHRNPPNSYQNRQNYQNNSHNNQSNYNQQQQQQQQQQLRPPVAPPATPPQQQKQPQQQESPQPTMPQKMEVSTPTPIKDTEVKTEELPFLGSSNDEPMNVVESEETNGEKKPRQAWMKRTAADGKISRRVRKRRQNARLRNILAPKNSMMVLHELHPELKMTISEFTNNTNQMSYTVDIEIDGKTYRGHGMSKMAAKQAASENALKCVLLRKIEEGSLAKGKSVTEVDGQPKGDTAEAVGDSSVPKKAPAEDDVPWGSLASFALYKLFNDWQNQGYQLPSGFQNSDMPLPQLKPVAPSVPAPVPMKRLPEGAHLKHPVQLLNQIRPGCQYIEFREGVPPNLTFSFTVSVDGRSYKGTGNSKKEAKKQCAKEALKEMGVVYND